MAFLDFLVVRSGVDSGGAGGSRAPADFGGSEKGKARFLVIGV